MVTVSIKTLTTKTCIIIHIQVYAANQSRSTNLILTGLSGTANNFWYGSIRGDTLNGILQATAGEKIIEF